MKKNYQRGLFLFFIFFWSGIISAQTVYTFSNAGATGRLGPTQAQVNIAYTGTTLANKVAVITQGVQEWTVPLTGVYKIEASGAQGGTGLGAYISGNFNLTAGTVINIVVGQQGVSTPGRSGGGGSFVVKKTTTTPVINDILVIAGGGGGTASGLTGTASGPSDLLAGSNNGNGGNSQGCIGGGGGFLTKGNNGTGSEGQSFINGGTGGNGISLVHGGFGGGGGVSCGSTSWSGGGGGFAGGAAGGTIGGGGSSYNAGSSQIGNAGVRSGQGIIVITWNPNMSVNNATGNPKVQLYSNPVREMLNFTSQDEIEKIIVMSIDGKKVIEKELNGEHKVDVQSLVKGNYVIQIFTNNGIETMKFVKY